MLDSLINYSQNFILERMSLQGFVSGDYNSCQERLIKSVLALSLEGTQNFKEVYFTSDVLPSKFSTNFNK